MSIVVSKDDPLYIGSCFQFASYWRVRSFESNIIVSFPFEILFVEGEIFIRGLFQVCFHWHPRRYSCSFQASATLGLAEMFLGKQEMLQEQQTKQATVNIKPIKYIKFTPGKKHNVRYWVLSWSFFIYAIVQPYISCCGSFLRPRYAKVKTGFAKGICLTLRTQQTMGPRDALRLCKDAVFSSVFSHEPVQKHQKDPWTFMFCTYKKTLANQLVTGNFRYSLPSGTCCQSRHRCSMLRPWGCWSLHVIASKEECCGSKSGAQGPGHTTYYIIYNLDIYVQPQVSVNKLSIY